MSRQATALAYELELEELLGLPAAPQASFRLLGGQGQGRLRSSGFRPVSAVPRSAPKPPYLSVVDVWQAEVEEPHARADLLRLPRVAHPRWLLGTLLGVAALAALVSPVFAAPKQEGHARRLVLSGYVAGQQLASAGAAPEIDTTTSSNGETAQEPQNEPVQQAGGIYELTGPPSLSVPQIEAVLAQYGSPAAGNGQALYELGVRYGLDPAYALAFFVHESGCGTKGVAGFTKSLGNIRWTEGYRDYEGYRSYDSWEQGFEDWYRLITELYIAGWNLRTVDEIIPVYAPSGDNNHPPTYIASVKALVDSWRGK